MFHDSPDSLHPMFFEEDLLPIDADVRVVPYLLSISKSSRALLGIKLAEIGFYNGQDETMLALEPDRPVTVSALADKLSVRPSTVSKMLDRLVLKKLVERTADKRDLRRTVVRITPEGMEAQTQIQKVREQVERELTADIGPADLDALLGQLRSLDAQLTKRLLRLR